MANSCLLHRIKGCLLGALVGDCVGAIFEFISLKQIPTGQVLETVYKIPSQNEVLRYTDDTAMTLSVAESLVANEQVNVYDTMYRFYSSFVADNSRGYGKGMFTLMDRMKVANLSSIFLPAREQFFGEGSLGNGGAMRIAPMGAVGASKQFATDSAFQQFVEMVALNALLTHYHPSGVIGALVQACAIRNLMKLQTTDCCKQTLQTKRGDAPHSLDWSQFVRTLKNDLLLCENILGQIENVSVERTSVLYCGSSSIELPRLFRNADRNNVHSDQPFALKQSDLSSAIQLYCKLLDSCLELLDRYVLMGTDDAAFRADCVQNDVIAKLGNGIQAERSVITALFCFLYAQNASQFILGNSLSEPFDRTLVFAICLGGDTDTIASMALALCGAFHGFSSTVQPPSLFRSLVSKCESADHIEYLADKLFEIYYHTDRPNLASETVQN